jgi:hypothetical protein
MDLKKIIVEEIKSIHEGVEVYHGSDRKFDDFDMTKIGSGDGKNLGGWGICFSDDENVSRKYATNTGFVGKYELRNGNYFDLDAVLDNGSEIIRKLRSLDVDENEIEEFQSDYVNYAEEYGTVDNKQAYDWLSYILGGDKEASLFLNSLGYIGNTFKDKWDDGARNYVVFNVNSIIK